MAPYTNQQVNTGAFVPTTQIYDIDLGNIDVNSPQFGQLFVKLYQTINQLALVLNIKETGYYLEEEFVTGGLFSNTTNTNSLSLRPIYRKIVYTGALAAGAKNVAHGLTIGATWQFVKIFGAATDNVGGNHYPLPFASAGGAANISVTVGAANVVITNNSGIAFTSGIVILEYLKY